MRRYKTRSPMTVIGFVVGLGLGCTTGAVIADGPADVAVDGANTPGGETTARAAGVVSLSDAPARVAPGGKASIALLATGEQAFVGHLSMEANAAVPEHRDPTEEYIYVLEGTGTIYIEDEPHQVGPETLIYMPANAKVRFKNGPAKMTAIQVFADPGPEKKYDAWASP